MTYRNKEGSLISDIPERWAEYFEELLKPHESAYGTLRNQSQPKLEQKNDEDTIKEPTDREIEEIIRKKISPGKNGITSEILNDGKNNCINGLAI